MNKRKKSRFILLGAVFFFVGFPLAGVLFSFNKAQKNIYAEAVPFAKTATQQILGDNDFSELHFLGTLILKDKLVEEEFMAAREQWGALKQLDEYEPKEIVVGERANNVWQFVTLETDAEFENGPARIKFVAARRSSLQQDWRIEEFVVSPANME